MSVQDLRSNSQDTSAFYLAHIYQILADSNVTVPRTSNPSTAPILPTFSPPGYAIWVNSLWFMSLVICLSCGLLATLLRQWARRYVAVTQPARCRPENRARMRAFFANGVDKMRVPLVVEILSALLHLSLFLFFSGLVIFLLNINPSIFVSVVLCIGLFSLSYGCATLMPIIFPDSPYYTPLSSLIWFFYAFIQHTLLTSIVYVAQQAHSYRIYFHFRNLRDRYRRWVSVDMWKAVEETAMKQSSKIDFQILDWTMGASVDENVLETYFGAVYGFANSRLGIISHGDSAHTYQKRFWETVCGFLGPTLSVSPINEALKARRLIICMHAMNSIICPSHVSELIYCITDEQLSQIPLSVDTGRSLAHYFNNKAGYSYQYAQYCIARILMGAKNRDYRWHALARSQLGLSMSALGNLLAHGDSIMLAIFLHVTRQIIRAESSNWEILPTLPRFDITNTLPELQHEFCALWNEIVQEARKTEIPSDVISSLHGSRHFYIALHQDTDAAPTSFCDSTPDFDPILRQPSSYPLCNIPSHHPISSHHLVSTSSIVPSPLVEPSHPLEPSSHRGPSTSMPRSVVGPHIPPYPDEPSYPLEPSSRRGPSTSMPRSVVGPHIPPYPDPSPYSVVGPPIAPSVGPSMPHSVVGPPIAHSNPDHFTPYSVVGPPIVPSVPGPSMPYSVVGPPIAPSVPGLSISYSIIGSVAPSVPGSSVVPRPLPTPPVALIVPTPPSYLGYASTHLQGSRSPSPIADPPHISPDVTPVTSTSIPEDAETIS